MQILIGLFLLIAASANHAFAGWVQFGDQSLPCSSEYDVATAKSLYTATVLDNGSGKLHFVKDPAQDKQCASDRTKCQEDAYLIPGDRVIVSSGSAKLACVTYISPKGRSAMGLLPASCLSFESNFFAKFDTPEILGDWARGSTAQITLAKEDDSSLHIDGEATRGPPSYNTGSISGPAFIGPEGETAGYEDEHYTGGTPADQPPESDEGCRVRLRSLTHFLIVDDNDRCGGQGVSFSGIYIKGTAEFPE